MGCLTVEEGITIGILRARFANALRSEGGQPIVQLMRRGELLQDALHLKDAGLSDGCSVELLYTLGPDLIITASNDCTARVFSRTSARSLVLQGHFGEVYTCILSPDQRHLVTASSDTTARIWEALEDEVIEKHRLDHDGEVFSAVFSQCGTFVATASEDATANMWSVDRGEKIWSYAHEDEVYLCTFAPDDQVVVTASADCSAALISVTGNCLATLKGHGAAVNRAEFSPDGALLVTASLDGTARIWERRGARGEVPLARRFRS